MYEDIHCCVFIALRHCLLRNGRDLCKDSFGIFDYLIQLYNDFFE